MWRSTSCVIFNRSWRCEAAERLVQFQSCALPMPVACIFLPGSFKLTGPEVDEPTIEAYVRTAFARAEQSASRSSSLDPAVLAASPTGSIRQAWAQLVRFGRMIGPIAADHGVTVAVEPLRHAECNVLNTVAESAQYVREVDHPGVRLLVDAYHWAQNGEPAASIIDAGPLLVHAHIATYENRLAPGQEACDFRPFFDALTAAEYRGRLSIEARWEIDEARPVRSHSPAWGNRMIHSIRPLRERPGGPGRALSSGMGACLCSLGRDSRSRALPHCHLSRLARRPGGCGQADLRQRKNVTWVVSWMVT